MGHIKLKFFATIFFICAFQIIVINRLHVQANQAKISIYGEPTYKLIKDIKQNNEIIGKTYEINVTLVNSGLETTDEITVNLTDEEHFSLSRKIFLNPNETEIVSFNWSTLLIKDQQIKISYYPTNPDTNWNQYNSGSKIFTVLITDEKDTKATSTPGFEMVLVITSMLIIIFF